MKMQIFSIYDTVAKVFSQPLFMANAEVATRVLKDWANSADTYIGKSPTDFSLYHIGEFDDETALLVPIKPALVIRADSLTQPKG